MKTSQIKTTFTAGEVSPSLLGRGDLRAYDNGALKLRNVFIQPTGGVKRRSGLRYLDQISGQGRLIAFEFNTEQTYLLVVTDLQMAVYANGVLQTTLVAPWVEADIPDLSWTQSADTLLLVHGNYPPKKLIRSAGGVWSIIDWEFYSSDSGRVYQPMYKFAGASVTVTPSGTSGSVTLTASASVFEDEHNGTRLRVGDQEVLITSVDSPTVVSVTTIEDLLSTSATVDWEEQSFSPVRGYPQTVVFHQDRLVIGGSRDLPNRLWMSQSGDLFNFDLGTGLDAEAVEFGIFSDQVNAICGVFSGRHLQVFTSGAEWMVTGDPLTPSTVQIKRQTRVGSMVDRYIAPIDVDGATLFVARNGQELREFVYTDVEAAYQSTDLALLSHHIIKTPIDQDYDQRRRLLFLIRADGKFATLTVYRAESVAAWTLHETNGEALSVSVAGDDVYFMMKRGDDYFLEMIDDDLVLDSALTGEVESPTNIWGGLDHLEGQTVSVVADGRVLADEVVTSGSIMLENNFSAVQVGLPFTHVIEPLPPGNTGSVGTARAVRLIEATFRVEDTSALQVDIGRGLKDITLRQLGEEDILDAPVPLVSGDIRVQAFGWSNDPSRPLWRIEQSVPVPFSLLAVHITVMANS
ncbi:MAG: hypothetical protein AUJ12_04370 [Alphaproteobacteria bacterium CG1_02_46_17]|nr:MAG: hypothetical protein AUJ12_04370 [Alphaproteobacteria bacterium CG1_02_46_17]